ncbi:MAE_28990/MAE_18760 family HEPN-like nuclease [Capnocytophaga stomatis]|uniref:MAE_28990/MAE_18760 family HEPN-like nuclease n=1 Tax=Capnocytophaga stomatis TaxID=1848904 RepID=UPI00385C28FC
MIFKQEFDSRKQEVEKYFNFLEKIDGDYRIVSNYEKDRSFNIDDELLKVLKANGFLILYNLIESTILNCVIAIFDEIKVKKLSYVKVSDKIKRYWSRHIYKFDEKISEEKLLRDKFYNIVEKIVTNVVLEITDRLEYGGSIDAKKIKKIADELGVALSLEHYKENLHGQVLVDIKNKRNDLAHGKKSFSDIARDVTYNGIFSINEDNEITISSLGLIHFKNYTIEHLEKFIVSIEDYINKEGYKIAN